MLVIYTKTNKRKHNYMYKIVLSVLIIIFIIICIKIIILSNTATINDDIIRSPITHTMINSNNYCEFTPTIKNEEPEKDLYKDYTEYEIYELAKIIMCEAEGESKECKEYVGQVIINRVESDKFPDTIHDVIFQGYQFSPTFDGRWESVEPNEDCYNAAYTVINALQPLTNALYFEACVNESWHSRNLIQVAKIDNTRFYIE